MLSQLSLLVLLHLLHFLVLFYVKMDNSFCCYQVLDEVCKFLINFYLHYMTMIVFIMYFCLNHRKNQVVNELWKKQDSRTHHSSRFSELWVIATISKWNIAERCRYTTSYTHTLKVLCWYGRMAAVLWGHQLRNLAELAAISKSKPYSEYRAILDGKSSIQTFFYGKIW